MLYESAKRRPSTFFALGGCPEGAAMTNRPSRRRGDTRRGAYFILGFQMGGRHCSAVSPRAKYYVMIPLGCAMTLKSFRGPTGRGAA